MSQQKTADLSKQDAEFSIVIEASKDSKIAEATSGFAKMFTLETKVAEQILKSAPIIFLSRLTKQDVRILKPKMMDLSNAGIEFRITARPQDRIPKVNWPIKPSFGTADGGNLVTAVSFIWDNNAFVCPACGETFVFRRVGKPKPAPAGVEAAAAAASAPAPTRSFAAPAPAKPAPAAAKPMAAPARPAAPPPKPAQKPAPVAAKKGGDDEDLGTVDLLDEVPTLDLDDVSPIDDVQPLDDIAPLDDIEEIAEPAPVKKGYPMKGPAPKGPSPVKPGGMIKPSADLDEVEEVGGGDEELASVFLNRIPGAKDQEVAAKIIAEVRGCPAKEAKELAARMVIPVVKDVPMKEAERILEKFVKAKIAGRITKKK
ncbi:MAG: hypothetical protein AAB074_00400 [Planctomycetota bacterium]